MYLTLDQIRRPVKLDYVTLEQLRHRDLLHDPIGGIRVITSDGQLVLQDLRERVGAPVAVGVCLVDGIGSEAGFGASGAEVRRCAVAIQVVAEHGGDARVDLSAGGSLGVQAAGRGVQLCLIGPDGVEAKSALEDEETRRVVGALLTILEYFAAEEEATRRGLIPQR